MAEVVVVHASAIVDTLVNGTPDLSGLVVVAPVHLDAEVLSALGRLQRRGDLSAGQVEEMLDDLAAMPVQRVGLPTLVASAFDLRGAVALRDALYVVVARALGAPLLTSDGRLGRACIDQGLCTIR